MTDSKREVIDDLDEITGPESVTERPYRCSVCGDVAAIVNSYRYSKPLGVGEPLRLWQRNEDTLDAVIARLTEADR